jgi:formylglycine-generating enzyme required for sulfatase activity
LAQQIQAELLAGRTLRSRAGAGPRLAQLQAQFAQDCPGLTVDALAAPPQAVADGDPPQCATFAREWAGLTPDQRQAQRDALLARVPGLCAQLRAEIGVIQSGSAVVDQQVISTATPAGTIFRDRAEGVPESALPEMVVIPAGRFLMGSPDSEPGRFSYEGPQRRVTIGQPFAVGRFEVTFDEWAACVAGGGCTSNLNPSDQGWGRGRRPVINVSWNDAQEYVQWLSRASGQRYRLLSEAEWEYAARAGMTTRWSFGDAESQLGAYAWFNSNSRSRTQPVGGRLANPWDLFDMYGNVLEWTQDCYAETYSGLARNGSANTAQGCTNRVIRGGSWFYIPQNLRSASRYWNSPTIRFNFIGFRVARTL